MTVRLRHIAAINPPTPEFDQLSGHTDVPFIPLEAVWPGGRLDVSRRRPKDDVGTGYTRFREGDILVPKITPTFQADRTVIAERLDGGIAAGTTELHIVRVGVDADRRYVRYLLSSKPFLDEGEASMIGVAGQKRVPDRCLRDLPVPVVGTDQQRTIADYLDAETAHIDALIEKKRRMVELLEDRRQGIIDRVMPDSGQPMRVRHLIRRLTSGPRGWAEYVADNGVLFLRITNVQPNDLELDVTDSLCVDPPLGAERRRTAVCEGDVLMSITADLGSVGIARAEHNGAAVSQHLALMTPQGCPGEWLALSLSTSAVKRQLDMARYGGTKTQLSLEDIRDIKVTVDKTCWNSSVLQAVTNQLNVMRRCQRALGSQIGLLAERRQALITAAVTGELAIPGIAA